MNIMGMDIAWRIKTKKLHAFSGVRAKRSLCHRVPIEETKLGIGKYEVTLCKVCIRRISDSKALYDALVRAATK